MRATLIVVLVGCAAAPAPPPAAPPQVVEHRPAPAPPIDRIASPATAAVVAKLDDPREAERAISELVDLGDPDAIPGLGAAWIAQGKPVRILAAIITLAKPRAWDRALPFLIRALADVDPSNPRSIDSAAQAAEAVGEARLPAAIDALIGLSRQPVSKNMIIAEVAAIRALGRFDTDKAKASAALVAIIERELPPHPNATNDAAREEPFALALTSAGAAINALAELRTTVGIDALVLAMYRMPELFTQTRHALVASGPAAETALVHVLRGDHAAVNALFKAKSLDSYCNPGGSACEPVSAKDFYPAAVLGDFHDEAIVPDLLRALERKPAPVYFYDDQPSPNTQHTAIFDALRKLGSPSSAASVRARWIDPKVDVQTRVLAVATYPFVVRDAADVDPLGAIAADNAADDNLRQEAATAFARLARSEKDIALLQKLAKRYLDASATKAKEAGRFKSEAATADREFEAQRAIHDKARSVDGKTADQIRAATIRADADFRVAKRAHSDRVSRFKSLDTAAKAYLGFARMFQTHIARVEIGIRCKSDALCFVASLAATPEAAAAHVATFIPDVKSWTDDERHGLVAAAIERAMIEIGKQGVSAAGFTDRLLDAATSDDRLIRQSILLALPHIAKGPCRACETKLDAAMRVGEGKTSIADLAIETRLLRDYYSWAGGRPPGT